MLISLLKAAAVISGQENFDGRKKMPLSSRLVGYGRWTVLAILFFGKFQAAVGLAASGGGREIFFEQQIRPLLSQKCFACHATDQRKAKGGLRLDSADRLFQGGHSGPIVVPGKPDESRLIQYVRGSADLRMPPDSPLEPAEVAALEQWVREGAVWPGYDLQPRPVVQVPLESPKFTEEDHHYWAYQPVGDPALPQVANSTWPTSEIDHFILARLEAAGIAPSGPAGREVLLRRVTFDLTGLPPTAEEITTFLSDTSQDAFEKVVDRLLDSPRYGERWGRHWLDVVRYGESAAHDGNNAYLHAWRYRDYVIEAFNEDKPYDRFVLEQLAGDLLETTGDRKIDYQQQVATGFLQVGTKPVVMRDKRQMLLDIADEQLNTTGIAFMGLTLGCARCHDHKFDAIPTADYYSMAGIFKSTRIMADHIEDSKWLEEEVIGPDGEKAKLMVVRDFPQPRDMRIHRRGSYRQLGPVAPRRFLQIIEGVDHRPLETTGSGRLELARWLTDPAHPLTARVMVNRLWQHHFGRGIVRSSGNFGVQGSRPTHPLLLDWLAKRFVESGWSIKAMHRLMLLTRVYQQASTYHQKSAAVDPENDLFWRMPRRRISAEEVRDAMLLASGDLDIATGGTLFTEGYAANDAERELYVVDISGKEYFPPFQHLRRSVYLPVIRNGRPEILKLFDVANAHEPTSVRGETTVAPQALFMLNSPFVRSRSENLAMSLIAEYPDMEAAAESGEPQESPIVKRVELAYLRLLGRLPTSQEQQSAQLLINRQRAMLERAPELLAAVQRERPLDLPEAYADRVRRNKSLVLYQRVKGIEFNGVDRMLEVDDKEALNRLSTEMTAEFWVQPTALVESGHFLIGRDGRKQRYWKAGVHTLPVDGREQVVPFYEFFGPERGGLHRNAISKFVTPLNAWTHVAFTFSPERRRLYVNGQLAHELEFARPLPVLTGDLPLTIGARGGGGEWFKGKIDHIALYDKPLSAAEIKSHALLFAAGTKHAIGEISPIELAAWRGFCQTLFCANEFVYVD